VALEPEIRVVSDVDGVRAWTTIDLVASVKVVKLHLYDGLAIREENVEDHGIACFTLNDSSLRYKSISDGAAEAQVVLKSFTISNTRPGMSKFREIIPAADHDRNQFMVIYTQSGNSSVAILTVDSPRVIFAIEPVIALLEFFTSAFRQEAPAEIDSAFTAESQHESTRSQVDFRLDLHDVSVSVLENDADVNSQAIRLYINQILLSQQVRPLFLGSTTVLRMVAQGILALTVNQLGMSLISMGADADTVRFLDDVDLTFSMDSRSSTREQMTSMELTIKPIVFRASYRDIMLITTIATKAVDLYGKSQNNASTASMKAMQPYEGPSQTSRSSATRSNRQTVGQARVLVSREQVHPENI
jgi:vacuolar protein sorting-associated protein 13A/C